MSSAAPLEDAGTGLKPLNLRNSPLSGRTGLEPAMD
jgi:hypothetical protein